MLRGSKVPIRRQPKLMPAGRICTQDGCETILSRHNKRKKCSLHEWTLGAPRMRGAKTTPAVEENLEGDDDLQEAS